METPALDAVETTAEAAVEVTVKTSYSFYDTMYACADAVHKGAEAAHNVLAPYEFFMLALLVILAIPWIAPYISKISFGLIKVQTLSGVMKNMDHDTRVRELVGREINVIDYEVRQRMRTSVRRITAATLRRFPEVEEVIYRSRVAISTSICDNHITLDLKNNLSAFICAKVEACETELYRAITPDERAAIVWATVHWVYDVATVLRGAVEQKLAVYQNALKDYELQRFKDVCQGLIDKNIEYRDAIDIILLNNTPEDIIKHDGVINTTIDSMNSKFPLELIERRKQNRRKDDPPSSVILPPGSSSNVQTLSTF